MEFVLAQYAEHFVAHWAAEFFGDWTVSAQFVYVRTILVWTGTVHLLVRINLVIHKSLYLLLR